MTKFFYSTMLVFALTLGSASQADAGDPGAQRFVDSCKANGGKIEKSASGALHCKGAKKPVAGSSKDLRTASLGPAKATAAARPASSPAKSPASDDAAVEAEFRADCAEKRGKVYTAADWNAFRPGANLVEGQLHCHRTASWVVDKK